LEGAVMATFLLIVIGIGVGTFVLLMLAVCIAVIRYIFDPAFRARADAGADAHDWESEPLCFRNEDLGPPSFFYGPTRLDAIRRGLY